MMHVMIRDDLVDHDYVDRYALGYDALVERARSYAPEDTAATIGLSADVIERFARECHDASVAASPAHWDRAPQKRGDAVSHARVPAGVERRLAAPWRRLARSTHALHFATLAMDRVEMPEVHVPGVRTLNMRDLGNDLCNRELDPPIRSLIVCGANPSSRCPTSGAPERD